MDKEAVDPLLFGPTVWDPVDSCHLLQFEMLRATHDFQSLGQWSDIFERLFVHHKGSRAWISLQCIEPIKYHMSCRIFNFLVLENLHTYNWILLSRKKEHIWISSNEVDEPRIYYTEWSKSERQKQISYTNTYIWNLERWYRWIYLEGSNGETDIENRLIDIGLGEEGEGGMHGESNMETYITIFKIHSQW